VLFASSFLFVPGVKYEAFMVIFLSTDYLKLI
jgi:hypothetical protein